MERRKGKRFCFMERTGYWRSNYLSGLGSGSQEDVRDVIGI